MSRRAQYGGGSCNLVMNEGLAYDRRARTQRIYFYRTKALPDDDLRRAGIGLTPSSFSRAVMASFS